MSREIDLGTLKKGDIVLVKCKVEAVFENSGMVMVTTRDCEDGFDAYADEIEDMINNGDAEGQKKYPVEDCQELHLQSAASRYNHTG